MQTNPIVGTGYESFWLGPRLQTIWKSFGLINESHNGYIEIYLSLGFIGLFLLLGVLIGSYRKICKQFVSAPELASLNLAFWTIALFYNMTESAFKFHIMWSIFLLVAVSVPEFVRGPARSIAPINKTLGFRPAPKIRLEKQNQRL